MPLISGLKSSAVFTPSAGAASARDVLGGAQEFKFVCTNPNESRFINTTEILIADATAVTTLWEVHLYSVTPPSAVADNGVFDLPSGDLSSYLGFTTIGQTVDYGAAQYARSVALGQQIKFRGTSVFAYLVPISAITFAAAAHTVTLHTTAAF